VIVIKDLALHHIMGEGGGGTKTKDGAKGKRNVKTSGKNMSKNNKNE